MGGGVEIVNFFSIDRERSTVHIYISARGFCVEKTVFKKNLGGSVLHIFRRNFFCVFFFGCHETIGYSSLDFFLSSYLHFFLLFFLRLLVGIFFPIFWSSHLSSESSFFALFHILLLTECFLWFVGRIYWLYLFVHSYLFV